jgi:general L-amino acid transport system substrate-binding protein
MRSTKTTIATSAALCAAILAVLPLSPAAAAEPTLAAVKKRGELHCGINGQLPGFSALDSQKQWMGFEIEVCRAIAAAVLGDAGKVKFVPLTPTNRFDALRRNEIDVLARNSTATLERTAKTGIRDAVVIYVDGQAVAVPKKLSIANLAQLDKATFCILNGTPYGPNLQEWFESRKLTYTSVMFNTQTEMYAAFYDGKCQAVTQDISALVGTIIASGRAADYLMLPEIVAKDPLAAYVRAGDDEWLDVVRWTYFVLVDAEERGVTKANVDGQQETGTPAVKRLLGAIPGNGKALGLDENWAFNVIKQVGNYSEIYERNLGTYSPLKFARGVNALWNNGGALYALPLR